EEIFQLVEEEIKRSGYDGLLPAGVILTGGASSLRGMRQTASRVMNMPARVAKPENLIGLVDQLQSPAYSTSVGLLYWAMLMNEAIPSRSGRARVKTEPKTDFKEWFKDFLRSLFP
ncbi:MAG: cell division protein FtsA, partial [Anaerolineae bacterium]|nr:cell division protein FtsA [Anaerolineae bacterium]